MSVTHGFVQVKADNVSHTLLCEVSIGRQFQLHVDVCGCKRQFQLHVVVCGFNIQVMLASVGCESRGTHMHVEYGRGYSVWGKIVNRMTWDGCGDGETS